MKTKFVVETNVQGTMEFTYFLSVEDENGDEYIEVVNIDAANRAAKAIAGDDAPEWLGALILAFNDAGKEGLEELALQAHLDLSDIWKRLDGLEKEIR